MSRTSAYRPDIDGLRALAVAAVVLFHYDLGPFSGGFVGVDIFFVISGYLITGIVAPEIAERRFSIVGFYERRLRRIVPAFLAVLVACLGASLFILLPSDLRLLGSSAVRSAVFVSNIFFYSISNQYFAADNLTTQPLLHTWSLSVEAQFYLVYPWILLAGRRWSVAPKVLLLGLLIPSALVAAWGAFEWPNATFYLLPARAWELLLGGLVAIGAPHAPGATRLGRSLAPLGLASIGVSVFAYTRSTPFPGLAALPPCLGAALLLWAGTGPGANESVVGRMLRARPAVFIGRLSYSIYLWHWPILVLASYGQSTALDLGTRLVLLVLTLILSVASWRWVERPLLRRMLLPTRRGLLIGAVAAVAVCAGLAQSFDLVGRGILPIAQLPDNVLTLANGEFDRLEDECPPAAVRGEGLPCRFGLSHAPPQAVLWGNSYARMWAPSLDLAANRQGAAGFALLRSRCPPLLHVAIPAIKDCMAFNDAALAEIAADSHLKTVVLGANWFDFPNQLGGLEGTIQALQKIGIRIFVVLAPPQTTYSVPRTLALAALRHKPPPPLMTLAQARQAQSQSNQVIETLRKTYRFDVIDPASMLCDGSVCAVERNGHPLYSDAGHVTLYAARLGEALFTPVFDGSPAPSTGSAPP